MTLPPSIQQAWAGFLTWLWSPLPFSQDPWAAALGLLLAVALVVALTVFWGIPWARRWWADETSGPDEDERGVSTVEMTLPEHLLELRNRLIAPR